MPSKRRQGTKKRGSSRPSLKLAIAAVSRQRKPHKAGHMSLAEVERYARAADQERMVKLLVGDT